MKNLAGAIIDHWWWIQRCEKELTEAFDDDFMGDHYESMISVMDNLDPEEMLAMREVATERMAFSEPAGPEEWGFSRRSQIGQREREFLTGIANWGLGITDK